MRGVLHRPGESEDGRELHALPGNVELRPGGDAVEVADVLRLGKREELLPGEGHRLLDRAFHGKLPFRDRHVRGTAEIEHRPALGDGLPGWQPRHAVAVFGAGSEGLGVADPRSRPDLAEVPLAQLHPRLDDALFPLVFGSHGARMLTQAPEDRPLSWYGRTCASPPARRANPKGRWNISMTQRVFLRLPESDPPCTLRPLPRSGP